MRGIDYGMGAWVGLGLFWDVFWGDDVIPDGNFAMVSKGWMMFVLVL